MKSPEPIVQELVLIGGGHSHAIALRNFAMQPLPNVRITLISEQSNTPYSGMLPGHVAGHYTYEDCHIDLRRLATAAQAQLYVDRATGLDLDRNQVRCAGHPPVRFDVLSIDIGSTPELPEIPGVLDYSVPVKPWRFFLQQWQQVIERVTQHPEQPIRIGVVGGGAGGVELVLTIQHKLQQILQMAGQPLSNLTLHLFHRGARVMTGHNARIRDRFQQILTEKEINLHLKETVLQVQKGNILCESGLQVECDTIFWVTRASAPLWPHQSGLATDKRGFIQVGPTLQSLSHSHIFAAGDIAAMVASPRPKAGVFAVRQGKPLAENLRRFLQGESLQTYHPQSKFLSLISTGDRKAIMSWGGLPLGNESAWLWRWKDAIDRKFMDQFRKLPMMGVDSEPLSDASPPMQCAGCGSKVGSSVLDQTLSRLRQAYPPRRQDILVGLGGVDDAAVVDVPNHQVMVHTLDYFRSLINDPFIFGQIAAHHSLSDLFAMGATPQSALAMATLPYGTDQVLTETLYHLLAGATKVLQQAGAELVGGHTTEGAELAFGLACNGLVDRDRILLKQGIQPDQALILTKPLGTGVIFAAAMRQQARNVWIDAALQSMLQSNQAAAQCFLAHQATACTDITGFGLVGHLSEMLRSSPIQVQLDLATVPIMAGVPELLSQNIHSSLYPQNLKAENWVVNSSQVQAHPLWPLLFDPQTSGGLLSAVPRERSAKCLEELKNMGYKQSSIIGHAISHHPQTSKAQQQPIVIA
ncbi:selenide, water dikinase SelD [Acaryochloris sp. IP29b_bin.137]|uniref:selenide, water dikinase SelD n=1 Tax=Acaryochloris sp. IP29b_bin.137 TaxID=2969217 RepID=UPI002611967F|nr:selenide, water dikinase SelD [Acaryochloris sp. IP29b_bin.137]